MDLNDLYKLAGISRDDAPAIEPQPVEQVAEQPTDGRADMRAMIALVTPEQLNQLVGEAPVEEGDEYAASTTPNPQEYKGTLGSPSDNSLRRYLDAAGDHVTIDEDVYPDHTVENVSEAYKSFKAKHKTEAYSPGDENEEGMVSNCCGAPIMDVYQGHGRCSDCKEMASAVKESIQESSADEFLKSLNQDPLYFPGAQITKNDDGSITLVASNGEEVADIDVKTGDIVLVNGDDYNIADDEDAEQNLQTMYAEINGDNGDMDMDEECKYCGGDCPNDEDHACDGYLGDIDGLYEAEEVMELDTNRLVLEADAAKMIDRVMANTLEGIQSLSNRFKAEGTLHRTILAQGGKFNAKSMAEVFESMCNELTVAHYDAIGHHNVSEATPKMEDEVGEAEALMAAQDMVDRIQGMLEDVGEMLNEELPPLTDSLRRSAGADAAGSFNSSASETLNSLLEACRSSREAMANSVAGLSGGEPTPMGDIETVEPDAEPNLDVDDEVDLDDFEASDAAIGGDKPLGRAKRD